MSSVYPINKGINRSIVFKGLKAQYIWWLGAGILGLLFLFAVMYILGVSIGICLLVVFGLGCFLFRWVYTLSNKYGEFGLMKKMASRFIPPHLRGSASGIGLNN